MNKIIFATNNYNKVSEVRKIMEGKFEILTLQEAGINIEIAEPYDTLEENAIEKATVINKLTGGDCFSEDTGLGVAVLNGEPGVKSARYAGEERNFEKNIDKLLHHLSDKGSREAQFETVICLILAGKRYLFNGICKGTIIAHRKGAAGFGYDPVFVPDGSQKTFAEMTMDEKNVFSHRKQAVEKLINFLNSI